MEINNKLKNLRRLPRGVGGGGGGGTESFSYQVSPKLYTFHVDKTRITPSPFLYLSEKPKTEE